MTTLSEPLYVVSQYRKLALRMVIIFLFYLCAGAVYDFTASDESKVVAFYNVYISTSSYDLGSRIVDEQLALMADTGLMDSLDAIYYNVLGNISFSITHTKAVKIDAQAHGNELETMDHMYRYCNLNRNSKVLYFHDKGSFHSDGQRNHWRKILGCYALNPNCLGALDTHDTCGPRLTVYPHLHYSGNFFWATCKYLNTLRKPSEMNSEIDRNFSTPNCRSNQVGKERYFAEAYIGTGTIMVAADCMPPDNDYTYYFPPHSLDRYCPNLRKTTSVYGFKCSTAAMLTYPERFKEAVAKDSPVACTNVDMLIKRNCLWFKQYPTTIVEARMKYGDVPTLLTCPT